MYPFYEKIRQVRHPQRLHPQGPVRAGDGEAVPPSAALCRCQRCRQGGQGLAAAQFPRLSLGLSLGRRRHARADGMAEFERHRPQLVGQRPRRDPAEIRRQQRLWRSRANCSPGPRVAEPRLARGDHGHAGQGTGRRSRRVGHRRGVDRLAAMADRRLAAARNPRGHAEEIRLRAARGRRTARSRTRSSAATRRGSTA